VAWWRVFVLPDIGLLWARLLATVKLWVWAVPGLPLLAAIGAWRCRRRPGAALLFLSFVLTFAGYLFIPFTQGHGWGYRYAHSAFGALPLLAAGALYGARGGQSDRRAWWRIWGGAAVLSLLLATTLRFVQVESFIDRHLAQIPARGVEGRMVIFLRPDRGYYPLDLIQNDPFLRNRRLRFLSQGAARNRELLDRYFPGARPLPPEEGGRAWRLGERSDVRRLR
jgi:hypothetical protein